MRFALIAIAALVVMPAWGAGDPAQGRKLAEEKKCEACHQNKVYQRKDRKVTSMVKLKAQVARCNSELNLQLFPEDEEHIVAWLNQEHYKFPSGK